jgi:DNA processing protein
MIQNYRFQIPSSMTSLPLDLIIKIYLLLSQNKDKTKAVLADFPNIVSDADLRDYFTDNSRKLGIQPISKTIFRSVFSSASYFLRESEKLGIKIISFQDLKYPQLLLKTPDCPVLLCYKGNIDILNQYPCVAVVGTRQASIFGKEKSFELGEYFARNGFNVVSGLAYGCDTNGHRGALKAGGRTTAVLSHGLDMVYPKENEGLSRDILDTDGLLLSEYFVHEKPSPWRFVQRDKIQAGCSLGVVLVEGDLNGGAMYTARFCQEYGRHLAAVDHPMSLQNSVFSKGNQVLIKEGKATAIGTDEELKRWMEMLRVDYDSSK